MSDSRLAPMMSSSLSDWRTPPELLTALTAGDLTGAFRFVLDAAEAASIPKPMQVAPRTLSPDFDSLANDWPIGWVIPKRATKRPCDVWLNPPYGRGVGKWIWQARQQSARLRTHWYLRASSRCPAPRVVCLLAARPDTAAWQEECSRAAEVCFLWGRLRFNLPDGTEADSPAPFPSALVVFDGVPRTRGTCPRVSWWDFSGGAAWGDR